MDWQGVVLSSFSQPRSCYRVRPDQFDSHGDHGRRDSDRHRSHDRRQRRETRRRSTRDHRLVLRRNGFNAGVRTHGDIRMARRSGLSGIAWQREAAADRHRRGHRSDLRGPAEHTTTVILLAPVLIKIAEYFETDFVLLLFLLVFLANSSGLPTLVEDAS
jgi:hypothetical protein